MHKDSGADEHADRKKALADPSVDFVALEQSKIKGAIRTDFILSTEIIVISLGTVAAAPFGTRVAVLAGIALIMTVGVYGLVAGIVKLDDGGLYLSRIRGADLLDRGRTRRLRAEYRRIPRSEGGRRLRVSYLITRQDSIGL